MQNALLPLDDKRYLKRCSEFDKLFRDTRQVLKKQEDTGNEIATPPPKRPKTKTPRATKKIKSPTPMPAPVPITNQPLTPDGISPPSSEKVVKKAAVSAKKTKPTKRAAKQIKQPVIPPIITPTTEFESILKNTTDTVIMPPPPTPPPLASPQPPPLLIKKETSRTYTKLLPANQTQLKPLTIQPFQPSVQKFTANPLHSPPTIVNLSSPKPLVTTSILAEAKVLPILPGTSFVPGNNKLKSPVILNNYKFPSPPTSSLSPVDNRGVKPDFRRGITPSNQFKLIKTGNGNLCIRYQDGSPQKVVKPKINIQKVQIIQPAHKSPVIMGKAPIFTTGSKPISIVKGPKFITSAVKHGNHSSNSNVIVIGSLPPPASSSASPIASSSTTSSISDNIINEDTPVDILSAPIEIADDDDGDSMNNHASGIVGVTDWEMELDQETNKNKNVEVSEVFSVEEGNAEIVEYEGDESFNDVIVEEEEETIIVDDGVTDGDSNKTSEDYGEWFLFFSLDYVRLLGFSVKKLFFCSCPSRNLCYVNNYVTRNFLLI